MNTPSGSGFLLGVNYPWNPVLGYGWSFGGPPSAIGPNGYPIFTPGFSDPQILSAVGRDLQEIRDCGVSVVRVWVFFDGRGGVAFKLKDGVPQEPTDIGPHTLDDLRALLRVAKSNNLYLVLSLLNHQWSFRPMPLNPSIPCWRQGGHGQVLIKPEWRQALLENVFRKIFEADGIARNPNVLAFEFMNEPEWIVDGLGAAKTNCDPADMLPSPKRKSKEFDCFLAFIEQVRDEVHKSGARFTISSNRLEWAQYWLDVLQPEKGDYIQIHYWNKTHRKLKRRYDLLQIGGWNELQQRWGCKIPVVWAEFAARGEKTNYCDRAGPAMTRSLEQILDAAMTGQFAGAWPWSWGGRDPRSGRPVQYDPRSNQVRMILDAAGSERWGVDAYGGPDPAVLKRWAQTNKEQINPGAP